MSTLSAVPVQQQIHPDELASLYGGFRGWYCVFRTMADFPLALQIVVAPLVVTALVYAWSYYDWVRRNPARLPYPPGPPGLPLLGNVFDMPKQGTWLTFRDWARQYGKSCILLPL